MGNALDRQYLGKSHGLDGLGYATNLVHFQQQGGARLLLYCVLDARWVCTQQIITNHLHDTWSFGNAKLSAEDWCMT